MFLLQVPCPHRPASRDVAARCEAELGALTACGGRGAHSRHGQETGCEPAGSLEGSVALPPE